MLLSSESQGNYFRRVLVRQVTKSGRGKKEGDNRTTVTNSDQCLENSTWLARSYGSSWGSCPIERDTKNLEHVEYNTRGSRDAPGVFFFCDMNVRRLDHCPGLRCMPHPFVP